MRKTILFSLIVMFGLSSFSQSISVKSFRALPNDMDARQNYPEKDLNGDLCAIIKIATLEKGFSFDIGSLGITKTEQKDGEIWIWIPRGAKRITITHKAFLPLRDYFFTESIQEGVCYELILVSGKVVTTVIEEEIPTQWLLINTNPPGADVYINDQAAGKTPYQNELAVGKYTWRVQKELYLNDAGVVELVAGTQKQKIDLTLKPNYGTVQLSSAPENGASVTLNGIETGKVTPCIFEKLPVGDHTITVSKEMYATTTERFTIIAGETKPLSINMNPTFAGISLSTEPIADIYINGEFKANSKWQGRLNPGIYTFEAKLDKHQTAIEKQTVTIGQPINLTLRPTPKTGNLKVMSTPFEATIKIDGKELGQTPITLKNILIGEYTVEISLPAYATAIEKATITEGQTATIVSTLQNGREITVNSNPTGVTLFVDNVSVGSTPWQGNLIFGNHNLRIEQAEKKAEKQISLLQSGGETSFTLSFGPQSFTESINGVNFDMIAVKGGTFTMGSPANEAGRGSDETQHQVTLSDFSIGKYEVTQKQWQAIMGNNPSNFKGDNLPVEQVSWNDVQEFIKKLNQKTGKKYRLPTEAEWEYAARGFPVASISSTGSETSAVLYSGSNNIDEVAWYSGNSGSKTHPVGQKMANELGIYDMTGNVWEWCSDWYGGFNNENQVDPAGNSSGISRVARGNSWGDYKRICRMSIRANNSPDIRNFGLGFRIALSNPNSNLENPTVKKEEIFEGPAFIVVETMPEFPGGEDGKQQYFAKNLIYPTIARSNGIQGKVFLSFIVEPNGSVSNVTVLRDIGGGCAEEAIRLVKAMPKWTPGKQHGKVVRVTVNTSVAFTL
jgi:TonB family protein